MDEETIRQMSGDIGEIKGMLTALTGEGGRLKQLEDAQTRQWWFTVGIAPALMLLRTLVKKLAPGINL